MKFLAVLLLLVVVPTAILTVVAARAVAARELVLRSETEADAREAVARVVRLVDEGVGQSALEVMSAISQVIEESGRPEDIESIVIELEESIPYVDRFYLFAYPWGFIYPDDPNSANSSTAVGSALDRLRNRLLGVLAKESVSTALVSLRTPDGLFCFRQHAARRSLYAGFSISEVKAREAIDVLLARESNRHFACRLIWPDRVGSNGEEGGVVIEDSFSAGVTPVRPVDLIDIGLSAGESHVIQRRALLPPLQSIWVEAVLPQVTDSAAGLGWQKGLYAWGVLLMAFSICSTSALLIGRAILDVKRAHHRTDFVTGVSHDLRTPITAVRMLAESLAEGRVASPERQTKFLMSIVEECDRLSGMLERVMFFMRQEQHSIDYKMRCVDVGELMEEELSVFRSRYHDRATISLDVVAGLPGARGDRLALSTVIRNLLDNALKYGGVDDGHGGRSRPQVALRAEFSTLRHRMAIRIGISDNGPGIPVRDQRRIFRKYYRALHHSQRHVGGTGLGLALCHDMIKKHRGRITVVSKLGEGSTFWVHLPVAAPEDGAVA
jgi:two-component system phosphate regulon sensor histidine kinase PhoR